MTETGRQSQTTGSPGIRQLWATAAQLNQQFPNLPGEFVPWRTIPIRETLLPRAHQDSDAIARYAQVFDALPPLLVQRNTFVLIDGRHGLEAAPKVPRDHVRIIEVDMPDEELWEHAFTANLQHGVPLKLTERVRAAKRYVEAHPTAIDREIADWAGVARETVSHWRQPLRHPTTVDPGPPMVPAFSVDGNPPSHMGAVDRSRAVSVANVRTGLGNANISAPKLVSFGQLLEGSPTELAESVPAEGVSQQIEQAQAAGRWLERYLDALRDRVEARAHC